MQTSLWDTSLTLLVFLYASGLSSGMKWGRSTVLSDLNPVDNVLWWIVIAHTNGNSVIPCALHCESVDECRSFTFNINTQTCTLFSDTFLTLRGNEITSTGTRYYIASSLSSSTSLATTSSSITSTASSTSITPTTTTASTMRIKTTTTIEKDEESDEND